MNDKLKVDEISIDSLQPNDFNVNIVPPENEAKIESSLKRFGFFKPVLVRTLSDGTKEIIGGEHRQRAAQRLGFEKVPIINLGEIDDVKAREISLVDNGKYGTEDLGKLAEQLKMLGDTNDLASFMPWSNEEINKMFAVSSIDIDEMMISEDDEDDLIPIEDKEIDKAPLSRILRFKVPYADADSLTKFIESVMKTQGFNSADSLTNAGDALVYIIGQYKELKK